MDNNFSEPENFNENNKPAPTESAEIVKRHLQDENHEITDDEIRNVRIVTAGNEPASTSGEAKSKFDEEEETGNEEEGTDPKDKPVTPWDVISD